ncbi:MAG TPA: serine hydrolase domain-containing protein [Candidatus Binataceae bacterium]|nr:serine hydrolase domain-containing protein [Candidatus Binataceae bacterium]
MNVKSEGSCDPRFKRVKEVFESNFAAGLEVGAAVAATVDGKSVVDLWAGHADQARTRPWQRDTLVNVYSTTKGITAILAHRLVDQGRLDLDAPVASYWPEFAAAGKAKIPVNYLLSHRAGMAAVRKQLPPDGYFNWTLMCDALAAQEPWWEPGTKHGYHALTFGHLVGEVIRRITGKTPGTYLREEITGPHELDIHIGVGASFDSRIADLVAAAPPPAGAPDPMAQMASDPESVSYKAIANPVPVIDSKLVNSRAWRGAEIPAANGHATARDLARLYGALAMGGKLDGRQVLTPASIRRAHTEQAVGLDAVLGQKTRWGLGFALTQAETPLGPNPHTFGHPGAGGSIGFADPDAHVSFGYVMNQMGANALIDTRAASLYNALFEAL